MLLAFSGVSRAGNVDLARWPGYGGHGCRLSVRPARLVGSLRARDSDERYAVVARPPSAGASCISGYKAPIRSR